MITVDIHELAEHFIEMLRMVKEEGVTFEIIDHGEVIAHVIPVHEPEQPIEQNVHAFWRKIDRLATRVGASLPEQVDAVEIVREGRRELLVSESEQPVEQSDADAWADLK